MKDYRDILFKDLISVSVIMIIIFIVCIVGFVIIRKLALENYLYILISIFLVATIAFGGYHIANVSSDLIYNSFETYTGKYSCPARDTLVLEEKNNMKLYAAISIPNISNYITIVYSRRSKIVVGFYLKGKTGDGSLGKTGKTGDGSGETQGDGSLVLTKVKELGWGFPPFFLSITSPKLETG